MNLVQISDLEIIPVVPREVYTLPGGKPFAPARGLVIAVAGGPSDTQPLAVAAGQLMQWYQQHGTTAKVVDLASWDGKTPAIIIATAKNVPSPASDSQWKQVRDQLRQPDDEGYLLMIDDSRVVVAGTDEAGAFYGAQCLLGLLRSGGQLPAIVIRDWPQFPLRAAMMFNQPEPEERFAELAYHRYNAVIFDTPSWYRLDQPKDRLNVDQWLTLCRKYGLQPIPLVQMGGHSWTMLNIDPTCAEGFTAIERVQLGDTPWHDLQCRNVLDLPNCPMVVKDASTGRTYARDVDYAIERGELKSKYQATNKPWRIARLATGHISPDATLFITYGYVAPHSESYCPSEPRVREIAGKAIRQTMVMVKPRFIHLGHDEIRVLGQYPRCRSRGISNAELLADDLKFLRDQVQQADPDCRMMIWADVLDLHQHAAGLSTVGAINLIPRDIVLCHWWYLDGYEQWMHANMEHTRRRGIASMGTVWYQKSNAMEWMKTLPENNRWNQTALGVILAPWPDKSKPIWQNLAFVGRQAWAPQPVSEPMSGQIQLDLSQLPLNARPPRESTKLLPINERFDELDDGAMPRGWVLDYSPNATTSQHYFGRSGKSFEVSGDRLVGRGARLYLDDTYCYGALHIGQQVWIDSKTADPTAPKIIEAYGPWFATRALLKIVGPDHHMERYTADGAVPVEGKTVPGDRWVSIDIVVDQDARTWSCWVDGQPAFTDAPLAAAERGLAGVQWSARTDGRTYNGFWIDDVHIEHYDSDAQALRSLKLAKPTR